MQIIIQAVVLRRISAEPLTLALYTERYGRITVHDVSLKKQWQEIGVGDICYVTLGQRGKKWFLYHHESAVTYSLHSDLPTFFWHHHLLDMYFYYVPLEQPSAHLFVLLLMALKISAASDCVFKILVIHFFALLGYFVPPAFRWYRLLLAELEQHTQQERYDLVMTLMPTNQDETSLAALDAWLLSMVSQHDYFRYLKTQQFLPQLYCMAGS